MRIPALAGGDLRLLDEMMSGTFWYPSMVVLHLQNRKQTLPSTGVPSQFAVSIPDRSDSSYRRNPPALRGMVFGPSVAGQVASGDDMPMSILWRYTCVEILKVMLLTTLVLVVVVAFGATIKPVIQNQIDPLDVGKYAFFASVPMLQFALPFAAGFSATIVMHRMANDNEILAMSVAGIRYRRIFMPAASLGLLLTIIMFVLVNFVIPRFWGVLQEMVARDVTRIFTSTIDNGEALAIDGTQLFADDIIVPDEAPGTGADERLVLLGVAALESDGDGTVRSEFTARYATVDIYHRREDVLLKLALVDATIYRPEDGSMIFVPQAIPRAVSLRKDLTSGPKTRDLLELLEIRRNPNEYELVARAREGVRKRLQMFDLWTCLDSEIADRNRILFDSTYKRERIELSGLEVGDGKLLGTPEMTLLQYEDEEAIRRASAGVATIEIDPIVLGSPVTFTLVARSDDAVDLRGSGELETRWPARIRSLTHPCTARQDRSSTSNEDLILESRSILADAASFPEPLVKQFSKDLRMLELEVRNIGLEVIARIVHRSAQSMTGFLLLMLGAVLAVHCRSAMPLTVYLLAFLPSVIDLLMISGGEQMVKYGDPVPGTILAFSGNLLLLVVIIGVGWRLSRN